MVPCLTLWGVFATFDIVESHLIRSYHTAAGAHLYREVAKRQTSFHREVSHHLTSIFYEIARSTAGGNLCHQIEGDVLGGDTFLQLSVHGDAHRLGFLLQDTLRGHHHLNL